MHAYPGRTRQVRVHTVFPGPAPGSPSPWTERWRSSRPGFRFLSRDVIGPPTAYDPGVDPDTVQVDDDPYLVAKDAAALVVLTERPEFRELARARLAAGQRAVVGEAGFVHTGLGTDPNRRTA